MHAKELLACSGTICAFKRQRFIAYHVDRSLLTLRLLGCEHNFILIGIMLLIIRKLLDLLLALAIFFRQNRISHTPSNLSLSYVPYSAVF